MNKLMEVLAKYEPPAPCPRCEGSGMVTVKDVFWTPVVCLCSACNGSGKSHSPAGGKGEQ